MLPLSALDRSSATQLRGLLFDLDDTLLDEGRLSEAAYASLFRLKESGLALIALTGRPAAWGEFIARMWPVDAAIAENGAISYVRVGQKVQMHDSVSEDLRAERQTRLRELVFAAKSELPALVDADDVAGRVTDHTFDIGEHHTADERDIQTAIAMAREAGARTTRSSVHLHFTFDRKDKATGALQFLRTRGVDATRALHQYAFVGDSENDAPCFAGFSQTVGVRNLRGSFSLTPRYRTEGCAAEGFVELASHLCRLRS